MTVTTLAEFKSQFGTSTIYYYLGNNGSHDKAGGDGGASTMVLTVEPTGQTLTLDEIVLIAGGGAATGVGFEDGHDGGSGGCAIATVGQAATGTGGDGGGNGGSDEGGNGNTGGAHGDADCPGSAESGTGGIGSGGGKGSDHGRGWYNSHDGIPTFNNMGNGGESDGCGGAGGGYGGGSGGSYALAATQTDTATLTACSSLGDATGVVKVVFHLDPS